MQKMSTVILFAAALSAPLIGCNSKSSTSNKNQPSPPTKSILGTWHSDWGPITLDGSNDHVTGFWIQAEKGRGQILNGKFDPESGKLTFDYHQDWNMKADEVGKADLTLSEDGLTLTGTWRNNPQTFGNWTAKRETKPTQ